MLDVMDVMREVASTASAHGSIALSEILKRKINLNVPSLDVISFQEDRKLINLQTIGIGIFANILVGLRGGVAFIIDESNAYKLIDLSYRLKKEDKAVGVLTEMGLSLIKEIGNIVIGAYLNAMSLMFKRMIIPPVPTLLSGIIQDIINIILTPYKEHDYSYLVESVFEEAEGNIRGCFYLVLTPEVVEDIKESCKKIWEDIEKDNSDT